jgi:hypothetical protein
MGKVILGNSRKTNYLLGIGYIDTPPKCPGEAIIFYQKHRFSRFSELFVLHWFIQPCLLIALVKYKKEHGHKSSPNMKKEFWGFL